jgi:hypothetical protein
MKIKLKGQRFDNLEEIHAELQKAMETLTKRLPEQLSIVAETLGLLGTLRWGILVCVLPPPPAQIPPGLIHFGNFRVASHIVTRGENVLRSSEISVAQKIFGPVQENGCLGRLRVSEIHKLYDEYDVKFIKLGRLRWSGRVMRMEGSDPAKKVLCLKAGGSGDKKKATEGSRGDCRS